MWCTLPLRTETRLGDHASYTGYQMCWSWFNGSRAKAVPVVVESGQRHSPAQAKPQ